MPFADKFFTFADMSRTPYAARRVFIRVRAMTGFPELVAEHGGDLAALLAEAGLGPADIANPDGVVALEQLVSLLDCAAVRLGLPDIGLRLAARQDSSVLGPVALVAQHEDTVGAALAKVARYYPYYTPGGRLEILEGGAIGLSEPGFVALCYDISVAREAARGQVMELSYAISHRFLRMVAPETQMSWRLHFSHPEGASGPACREFFGIEVPFSKPRDALIFPVSVLAREINRGGSGLAGAAERLVALAIRRHPLDIGGQVEALAERLLVDGCCTRVMIASQLGLHERTLQRRLAAQGLVFEAIIDDLRQARAREYLAVTVIPLAEVARLVGYTEQSSFNRACVRWFAATPGTARVALTRAPKN